MIGHENNRTKGTNNAPIPEDNEQYCFKMPLKLKVHKRYWTIVWGYKVASARMILIISHSLLPEYPFVWKATTSVREVSRLGMGMLK